MAETRAPSKRAVVTGGAGLIGQAIIRRLLDEGWEAASLDLVPARLGRSILCDLTDEAAIGRAFAELGWDRLDLLVNNGGRVADMRMSLADAPTGRWHAIVGSHLTGAFLVSRAALPQLTDGSTIVMIASTRALMSEGDDFAYAAAKGGLISLAQALSVQLGPRIRVNTIAPGWIASDHDPTLRDEDHAQHPAGRVGRGDDIAGAVLYLAGAGFVTGQTLTVDGGMTRKMIYLEA